jgi:diacylglycerol kinase (ATP)
MRATLFHNPTAGRGDHEAEDLVAALERAHFEVAYHSTKDPTYVDAFARPGELVVVAGGDGTVRRVMTRHEQRHVPILILPCGTANNVARSLGISGDPFALIENWKQARERPFDIGTVTGPWGEAPFIEAFGCGALAATMGKKMKGDRAAKIKAGREALAKAFRKAAPLRIAIDVDGRIISGEWLAMEILNNPLTGPGLRLAPEADQGDGLLDIVGIHADCRNEMIGWLEHPGGNPPVMSLKGRRVAVEVHESWPRRIDDNGSAAVAWDGQAPVVAELQEEPLRVLVPGDET